MKNFIILIACAFCIGSCQQTPRDFTQTYPLIDRKETLKNGKEWENMHNLYTRLAESIRKKPAVAKPYVEMAELFMVEARVTGEHGHYYPMALKLIETAQSINPEDPDLKFRALSDKASVLLSLHQFQNAKTTADEAIKSNPYNAQIYGALVDANVELGNYPEAVANADKMVSIRPDLRSYSRVSYLREIYGDLNGAIDAMKQAVEAGYPGYEETCWTRLQLGNLYKKQGRNDLAENEFQQILSERPNYAFALSALAEMHMDKNELATADKLLSKAIAIMPEVHFYILKAEVQQKSGQVKEAMTIAREVLDMLKDDEKAGHRMDLTYAQVYQHLLQDPQTSLQYAMKEYEIRPDNVEVNKYLVDLYTQMGDTQNAILHKAKMTPAKI
ncbi:MAG: tetratricopeptide repeat protein [Saprospiraceae bacterium]|nr:tetratricopeptide repeat protein [Saprospiraceae bacterium]